MSAPTDKPNPSQEAHPSSPSANSDAFERAEARLAAGNETANGRAIDAEQHLEHGENNAPPKPTDLTAFRERKRSDGESGEDKAVGKALADKELDAGVADANDTARIEMDLTSHNI